MGWTRKFALAVCMTDVSARSGRGRSIAWFLVLDTTHKRNRIRTHFLTGEGKIIFNPGFLDEDLENFEYAKIE